MTGREAAALALVALLLAYVAVVVPWRTPRLLAALRARIAEDPGARFAFYVSYLRTATFGLALCLGIVWLGGRGYDAAGLGWPADATGRFVPGLLLSLGAAVVVLWSATAYATYRDPAAVTPRAQWERVEILLPRTPRERRIWPVMSLTVGVLEEVVYRGVCLLFLADLLGVSAWWFLLPVTALFGIAHAFQGWLGIVGTAGLGLAFGILSIVLGTIWPAVALHALFDVRLLWLKEPPIAAAGPAG